MKKHITWLVKLIPSRALSLQARKPSGMIGRYLMTQLFNHGNADLNSFVKQMLDLKPHDRVLEIGFGPGKLIRKMAEVTTTGCVEGIDFSETMLKEASRVNRKYLETGKVKLHHGECRSLPFVEQAFDKLCSTNTLYFWKEPEPYFAEMFRVLKPGGKAVIGFRDDAQMASLNVEVDIFNTYAKQEVIELFSNAGFTDVFVQEQEGKPFISYCAVAFKR